jgi:hypothetical protein
MASSVEISNSALTKLGAKRIMDLADTQKEAREINAIFTIRRDYLLRCYNWSFAMKRASLSALVTTPISGYTTEYQLPSDCLRVVQVSDHWDIPGMADYLNSPDEEMYRIEGKKILTNLGAPLKIRYSRQVTNTGDFDSAFVEVFASDLAFTVAEALTQSNSKKEAAREDRREAIMMAIRSNAIELPPQMLPDSSWVLSRF